MVQSLLILFLFNWNGCENVTHPKVSVIIPVYNMVSKISICLNSILKQTLKEIEIICVDDGSVDRSLQILNEFAEKDKRIIIAHQENWGPACARNKGVFLANGEYLGFVDSDDWVESALFETAYETAKSYDVDVVEFDIFRRIGKFSKEQILRGMEAARSFIPWGDQGISVIWSRIYRKSLVKGNGILFETTVSFGLEDAIFNLDLIPFVKSVAFINTSFYHYTPLENGLSRNYKAKDYKSVAKVGLLHLERVKQYQHCLTKEDFQFIRHFLRIIKTLGTAKRRKSRKSPKKGKHLGKEKQTSGKV